jgi:peptide chain release factor subunit 1
VSNNNDDDKDDAEKAVEQWKIKKLIQTLEEARGNGTSMISLILPPKDQIARVSKMLGDELGTATNIKSRVNRLSVLGAITSVQQRLKLYNRVPTNGLVIYCGTIITQEGKEKKVSIDFEPFKPINTSLYLCDNKFHTESLKQLLESDERFGFIVMDGNGCLYGVLAGNHRSIMHKFSVDLPKKHGRGGQSALRFARLRLEKRHNYIRKCAELATQMYITNDKPNVSGLVLAGAAEFKSKLNTSELFDPRLANIVVKIVDVSYGGENGFSQAIELAAESLSNVKFVREKKLLTKYFGEIALNSDLFCFGWKDTLHALEAGALDVLIVWENLGLMRYNVKNSDGEESILILNEQQRENTENFKDKSGNELEVIEGVQLLEWLASNFKEFGTQLQFVSNRSEEGSQFCKGFGGIGGLLRYAVDFELHEVGETEATEFQDSDDDYDDFI